MPTGLNQQEGDAKGGTVALLHDYREKPVELFDGLEPATLIFYPRSFGLPDYKPVDLVAACSDRPEHALSTELQRELQSVAPSRVRAFNKSISRHEFLLGYYAISHSSSGADRLIVLFSFFEVSPARFHANLHALLRVD